MHKTQSMMLCSFACKVAFIACVECTEQATQCLELPFAGSHGTLVNGFLTAAKFWCTAQHEGKEVAGEPALKVMFAAVKSLQTGGDQGKLLMRIAPFVQLLDPDQRKHVRMLISTLHDAPGQIKRLGSKMSLGMLKKKKALAASSSVSSSSGACMKIDLFDYQ